MGEIGVGHGAPHPIAHGHQSRYATGENRHILGTPLFILQSEIPRGMDCVVFNAARYPTCSLSYRGAAMLRFPLPECSARLNRAIGARAKSDRVNLLRARGVSGFLEMVPIMD